MRKCDVPVLAVLFWIVASGAGSGAEMVAGPLGGKIAPPPNEDRASCKTIAAILAVYPTLAVGTSEGPVRGVDDDPPRAGCTVRAAGLTRGLIGEVPPEQALRDLLGQLGWEEDLQHTADGPGTFSFLLRKGKSACLFSGGAPSGIEDGKDFTAETYELEVRCAAGPDR